MATISLSFIHIKGYLYREGFEKSWKKVKGERQYDGTAQNL